MADQAGRRAVFQLGLNHIDPASMRYPENIHLWRDKYGGSMLRWLKESVATNLKAWGFNSVGWVQETTVRQWKHSRAFTPDEYHALGLPYCHLLPFTESHQWTSTRLTTTSAAPIGRNGVTTWHGHTAPNSPTTRS